MVKPLTSLTKHLVMAYLEWIEENDELTMAHIGCRLSGCVTSEDISHLVDAEGFISFNIAAQAVRNFTTYNEGISFEARFSGKPVHISIRYSAMLTITSVDQRGMYVSPVALGNLVEAGATGVEVPENLPMVKTSQKKKSFLKIVK